MLVSIHRLLSEYSMPSEPHAASLSIGLVIILVRYLACLAHELKGGRGLRSRRSKPFEDNSGDCGRTR